MFYSAPTAVIAVAVSIVVWVLMALSASEWDMNPKKIVIAQATAISLIGSIVCGSFGIWYAGMVGGINGLIVFLIATILLALAPK
ncbi:MAG: hypothetical protein P4L53_04845 [Candidatus Obscuribacterales bacterium]|nr:hypothetical protein [Candidatus Obscuribacterales bacterium]